jgi:hypothetical protein
MITQELLLLEYDNLIEKIDTLFKKLITDNNQNYLQVFLTNPSEFFVKELIFDDIEFPLQEISDGNRFLFSVLSNDLFYKWLQDYQNDIIEKMQSEKTILPDKNQILKDMAGAMVQFGDKEIAFTFLNAYTQIANRQRPRGHGDDDVAVVTLVAVAIVVIVVAVIAPIALISLRINPLGSTILPTNISVQQMRSLADQLVSQAKKYKEDGKLTDINYNFN